MKHVRDGSSTTIALSEDAGRPFFYVRGKKLGPANNTPGGGNLGVINGRVRGAGWADPINTIPLHGFSYDGLSAPGPFAINSTNNNESYSFHSMGVNIVFVDGHVQFVNENIDIAVYAALITPNGSEAVPSDF